MKLDLPVMTSWQSLDMTLDLHSNHVFVQIMEKSNKRVLALQPEGKKLISSLWGRREVLGKSPRRGGSDNGSLGHLLTNSHEQLILSESNF